MSWLVSSWGEFVGELVGELKLGMCQNRVTNHSPKNNEFTLAPSWLVSWLVS